MDMLFLTQTTPSAGAPATGQKTNGAAAQPDGFAALLALLQGGQAPRSTVVPVAAAGALREITIPGDAGARGKAFANLLAQLRELAGRTMAALGEVEAGGGAQGAADGILADAARQLAEMLRGFDAETGADSLATLMANLASLQDDPRFAVPAATTPPTAAPDSPASERAEAMFALAAELLGLAQAPKVAAQPAALATGTRRVGTATDGGARPATAPVPGLSAQPTPQPEVLAPAPVRPQHPAGRSEITGTTRDEGSAGETRIAAAPHSTQAWAREMLTIATQAKPAGTAEAAQQIQAQPPLPQVGAELRLSGGIEAAAEARGAAAQPQAGNPPDGFARNLATQIRSSSFNEGRTRIELSPRGLGSIEIDLQADEAGKMRVVLRAENPAVLNALRGDRATLLAVLGDGGVAVEDSALDFEAFGQQRQRQGDATPAAALAAGPAEDEADTAAPPRNDPRPLPGSGRLDIIT